ncbi:MAG TPA: hypothetical protein VJZ51_03005 [Bacilli bacterium]|nr:hypothetical protein [Bacilli bacterium]
MKRLDYLIIVLVMILSISFYAIYFANKTKGNDLDVEILYQNEVIYKTKLVKNTNITVEIIGENNVVTVVVDNKSTSFNYTFKEDFYNTVTIIDDEIKMVAASCKNHDCLRMRINKMLRTPIVCTNGVIIKLVTSEIEIIS